MKFNNMLSGLLLCSFASLLVAGDEHETYKLYDYDSIYTKVQTTQEQTQTRNVGDLPTDGAQELEGIVHGQLKETVLENDNAWLSYPSFKEYGKQQLIALSAGAVILGYAIYKSYLFLANWAQPIVKELEQEIAITAQDRDILFGLVGAMKQDVQNLREGKHEPSLVAQSDLTGLSEIIASECNFIRDNFVELYNIIEPSGVNIDVLVMFYEEFDRATQALIAQAAIA